MFFFFLVFLGPHPPPMEVPRLRVKPELQLLAYTTDTAMWDQSHIFDLYHSSPQPIEWGQASNPRLYGSSSGSFLLSHNSVNSKWSLFKKWQLIVEFSVENGNPEVSRISLECRKKIPSNSSFYTKRKFIRKIKNKNVIWWQNQRAHVSEGNASERKWRYMLDLRTNKV